MTEFCRTVYCIAFVQIYFIKLTEVCFRLENNAAYTVAAPFSVTLETLKQSFKPNIV